MTGLPAIPVVLSTSSVYPEKTPDAFEAAAGLATTGVEVMVYTDPVSQSGDALARLVDYHQVPVLAVHAPGLLLTQLVWGREPWSKLMRAKDLAERLGAKVVVVHPPFRWQREYTRGFEQGIAKMSEETDVIFAVENMFPIRAGASEVSGYAPHWDPTKLDVPNVTLDLSHTAASASDAIVMANDIGSAPRAHPPGRRHRRVERPGPRRAPGPRPGQAALRRAAPRHRRHRLPGHGGRRGEHPARGAADKPAARPGRDPGLRQNPPVRSPVRRSRLRPPLGEPGVAPGARAACMGSPGVVPRGKHSCLLRICNCKQGELTWRVWRT